MTNFKIVYYIQAALSLLPVTSAHWKGMSNENGGEKGWEKMEEKKNVKIGLLLNFDVEEPLITFYKLYRKILLPLLFKKLSWQKFGLIFLFCLIKQNIRKETALVVWLEIASTRFWRGEINRKFIYKIKLKFPVI